MLETAPIRGICKTAPDADEVRPPSGRRNLDFPDPAGPVPRPAPRGRPTSF